MKVYKLTKEGRKFVKIPTPKREEVLDHLYEFSTATSDELQAIDPEAKGKLYKFKKAGYVEEINEL